MLKLRYIAFIILSVSFTFKTTWMVNLDNGAQSYQRSILGLEIESLSEYNYVECIKQWNNPFPNLSGHTVINTCYLLFGCWDGEVLNRENFKTCGT